MPYIMNDRPPQRLTPWFPRRIKPVRNGVYLVKFHPDLYSVRATWRRNSWRFGQMNARASYWPLFQWRGLAQEPQS